MDLFLYHHVISWTYSCTITWFHGLIPVPSRDFMDLFLYHHVISWTYSCTITWFHGLIPLPSRDFMDVFLYHHVISWTYSCTIKWFHGLIPVTSRDFMDLFLYFCLSDICGKYPGTKNISRVAFYCVILGRIDKLFSEITQNQVEEIYKIPW
jgi:hypothetical protein